MRPIAEVLGKLGCEAAWVVHGDGMDELTTTGVTIVATLKDGKVASLEVTPEEAGLQRASRDDLKGGEPADNAARLQALLRGEEGPLRDVVLLNSAAALIVAGKAKDLKDGVALAAKSIDGGKAAAALARMVAITNEPPPLPPP